MRTIEEIRDNCNKILSGYGKDHPDRYKISICLKTSNDKKCMECAKNAEIYKKKDQKQTVKRPKGKNSALFNKKAGYNFL